MSDIRVDGSSSASVPFRTWPVLLAAAALAACAESGGPDRPPAGVPTAHGACSYVALNQALTATLRGTDPEDRPLVYEVVDPPRKGAVTLGNPLTGQFTYTPNTDARGTDQFTFRVSNNEASSNVATYRLVYTPRIMPLGDSITEGVTVGGSPNQPPPDERISYRRTLLENLSDAGYAVDLVGSLSNGLAAGIADPDHEGHPGWCDDNLPTCHLSGGETIAGRITSFLEANRPDVVLLHIGTNHFSTDASGVNLILDLIGAWARPEFPVTVFVARIIPTLDGTLDVTTFNDNVEAVAGDRPNAPVVVVDMQAALRSAADPNRAEAAFMADNLHPNDAGYDRMGDRWSQALLAAAVLPRCD